MVTWKCLFPWSPLTLTLFLTSVILTQTKEGANCIMTRQQRWHYIGFTMMLVSTCVVNTVCGAEQWHILQKQDPEIRDYFSIAFASPSEGWVVGISAFDMDYPGFIGHTADGGRTWTKAEVEVDQNLSDVHFFDKQHGWAVGSQGMVVATKDAGRRWNIQVSKVSNELYGVRFVSEKVGFAVGMGETILQTTNGGNTWKILRGGQAGSGVGDDDTIVFKTIYFVDDSIGWVAGVRLSPSTGGQDGIIQKTVDGGQNWINQPTDIEDILKDIFFVNELVGWAVGENGVILGTTDGGDTWNSQTSGTEESLLTVQFASKDVGWAAGGALGVSVIMYTKDGGETWEQQVINDPMLSKIPINDVFVMDEKHVWATGNNGVVIQYK